jgi:hypothetical protein
MDISPESAQDKALGVKVALNLGAAGRAEHLKRFDGDVSKYSKRNAVILHFDTESEPPVN